MATQQQQAVTAVPSANIQPHPVVVLQAQPLHQTPKQLNYKRIIKGLAISEIILGSISVALGIASIVLSVSYRNRYFSIGEGIWCGVWIVIAGALGIPSAKVKSSRCIITCHLAFSIVGALVAAFLCLWSIIRALLSFRLIGMIIRSLDALVSFSAMILLIISASYCCALRGCCCSQGAGASYGIPQGQVVYTQQAGADQGIPGSQPGYFVQGYQPVAPNQNVFPQTNMMQQPFQPPQVVQNPNDQNSEKQQEALGQAQMQTNAGIPPAYENVPAYNQM